MNQNLGMALSFLLFIAILTAIWLAQSTFEARAFNAVTGEHVTTWQAMWIDLRVVSGPQMGP